MTIETVLCANCEDRIPEHEAWPIGDKWACSDECRGKIEEEAMRKIPCEGCGELVPEPEIKNFQGWQVCEECLPILREEEQEFIELKDRDWGRKVGIFP